MRLGGGDACGVVEVQIGLACVLRHQGYFREPCFACSLKKRKRGEMGGGKKKRKRGEMGRKKKRRGGRMERSMRKVER